MNTRVRTEVSGAWSPGWAQEQIMPDMGWGEARDLGCRGGALPNWWLSQCWLKWYQEGVSGQYEYEHEQYQKNQYVIISKTSVRPFRMCLARLVGNLVRRMRMLVDSSRRKYWEICRQMCSKGKPKRRGNAREPCSNQAFSLSFAADVKDFLLANQSACCWNSCFYLI